MNTHAHKTRVSKGHVITTGLVSQQMGGQLENNRPEAIAQRKLQGIVNHSAYINNLRAKQTTQLKPAVTGYTIKRQALIQKKRNNNGLTDQLKSGIENLSGLSLDDVRVHYNSRKPTQLKGGKLMSGTLATIPGKAPLQARWAAKKTFEDGREYRYWKPGVEDAENKFRQGWYARAYDGGWGNSARFINADPLVLDAPGVESLSRLAFPSASDHKLMVVEERSEFVVEGRGRREALTSMPMEVQLQRFGEIAAWCAAVDSVIELFEKNEQDVTVWRNRLAALSAAQIALGLVAGGLIVAGIVATGGLAAIPMAAGAIAIGVSSAAAGVGVGAARAVAEHGLSNAQQEQGIQHGKAKVGGLEVTKGGLAVGTKEGITRGLMAAAEAGAAEAVGVAAGGGGAAISVIKGGMGAHRAYKVDVGEIYKQVKWGQLLNTVRRFQKFVNSNAAGFNVSIVSQVKAKLKNTGDKIFRIKPMRKAVARAIARKKAGKA